MARRKTTTPAVTKKEVKEEVKVTETLVEQIKVTSNLYMTNPFTKQRFLKGDTVPTVLDSWVKAQIAGKLLVVV